MVTFVQATFVLAIFVHIRNISAFTDSILTKLQKVGSCNNLGHSSISAISQRLLTQFGPNLKVTFLGPSLTYIPTLSVTFVQVRYVLVTLVHICNISNATDLKTSKVGYWEYLELIPIVIMTFVKVIFVLTTFLQIKNISAVRISQLLLTKFFTKLR